MQIQVFDAMNNSSTCDPLVTDLRVNADGTPGMDTFTDIPAAEHFLVVANDMPGLERLTVTSNGMPLVVDGLQDGEERMVDLAIAIQSSATLTLQLMSEGRPSASAMILVGDMPLAGTPTAATPATAPSLDLAPEIVAAPASHWQTTWRRNRSCFGCRWCLRLPVPTASSCG